MPAVEGPLMALGTFSAAHVGGGGVDREYDPIIEQNAARTQEDNRRENQEEYFFHRIFKR